MTLLQDDTFVILTIRTPHVKADELDLEVSRHVFKFYVKPYYLSLTFRQDLSEVRLLARLFALKPPLETSLVSWLSDKNSFVCVLAA